jgi:hypothetical protein
MIVREQQAAQRGFASTANKFANVASPQHLSNEASPKAVASDSLHCPKGVAPKEHNDCPFCGKILSKEKGEEDHGCLDCHGYIYIVNDVEVCFHCIEKENNEFRNTISELQAKNKIMTEALEFYADNRNWKVCSGESWSSTLNKEDCSLLNCGGGRARVALKINRGEL